MKAKPTAVLADGGSFRDPAGFVLIKSGTVYRQVNKIGKKDYDHFISSGLYGKLAGQGMIVAHQEVGLSGLPADGERYKVLKPTPIPFISYPYEWSFSQLKQAALLKLKVQNVALAHGMILKDASAYNVQFIGRRPIFIDSLSFRIYKAGAPWDGYRQFCEHFVAPLAIAAYSYPDILKTLRSFLDGIPLREAAALLPARARLRRGLALHIYLHRASQRKYDNAKVDSARTLKVSPLAMNGLMASLEKTIKKLKLQRQITQWGDYYSDTNYSKNAFLAKKRIVSKYLASLAPKPKMVWDLGANDGTFSEITARAGACVVSFDIDPRAVELNFSEPRDPVLSDLIIPLVQDLTNPSPALGWAHRERASLVARGPADLILALALIHHMAIGNNLPFSAIADFFCSITKFAIIEFVPKSDSKAQILLRRRANMFEDYTIENFELVFNKYFKILKKSPIKDSQRVIYLLKSRSVIASGQNTS